MAAQALLQKENNITNNLDTNFTFFPKKSFSRVLVDAFGDFKNTNYDINSFQTSTLKPINIFTQETELGYFDITDWNSTINKIKTLTGSNTIDFAIDEFILIDMIRDAIEQKNDNFKTLITHANSVVSLSDGAAHTKNVVPFLNDLLKDNKLEPESAKQKLTLIKAGNGELTNKDIKDFIQLENFIHFLHYDARYIVNINNIYHVSSFDLNYQNFSSMIFNNQTYANQFNQLQSQLFIGDSVKKLEDLFVHGFTQYDPQKKNAIFLGSSLFTPFSPNEFSPGDPVPPTKVSRLETFNAIRNDIQIQFKQFLTTFNPNEYNVIFKLHPVYKGDSAIEYVKLITNNLISEPIILTPSIPIEILLSNDYHNYKNQNGLNFIFKGDNQEEVMHHTKYFGLQGSTSSIHTTRLLYKYAFSLTDDQVNELITYAYFPIPVSFPVINRLTEDNNEKDYYEDNVRQLNELYKWYNPSYLYKNANYEKYDLYKLSGLTQMYFNHHYFLKGHVIIMTLSIVSSLIALTLIALIIYKLISLRIIMKKFKIN